MHHTGARHEFTTTDYCAINSVYEGSVVLFSAPRRHEATVERLLLLLNMASFMLRSGLSKVGVVVAIAALVVLCCASDASGNEQRENEKRKRYFLDQGRELMKSISIDGLGDSALSLENHVKGPDALRFQSEQAQTQKGGKGGKSTKKKAKSSKKSAKKKSKSAKKTKGGSKPKPKPKPPTKPTKPKQPPKKKTKPQAKPIAPFLASPTSCVMCEYVLEAVIRKVKSQPPLQQSISVTDFGGTSKIPEDAFRTYQGPPIFLEVNSHARKGGSKGGKKKSGKSGKSGGGISLPKPKPVPQVPGPPVPDAPLLPKEKVPPPMPPTPKKPSGLQVGQVIKKQIEQVHIQNENSAEFEATYKQWMDALDDVCYHDLPPTFYSFCKPIYENGDKIVEMYLHGYEDYEICSSVSCPKNFFEDGQKINATKF